MDNLETCCCMLPQHSCPLHQNSFDTINLEMETNTYFDIFGSLSEIQSIPPLYAPHPTDQTDQTDDIKFQYHPHNQESSSSSINKIIHTHDDDYDGRCLTNDEFFMEARRNKPSKNNNRKAGDVRTINEKKRRERIRNKMKDLQELIPNCRKPDRASILDDAIKYLKYLQSKVEMSSATATGAVGQCHCMSSAAPFWSPTAGMGICSVCPTLQFHPFVAAPAAGLQQMPPPGYHPLPPFNISSEPLMPLVLYTYDGHGETPLLP